jgi:hypothetical protein
MGGNASAAMTYSLSPRTQMDLGVSQTYVTNRYQKATGTTPHLGLGRQMGRNWFLRLHGGMSHMRDLGESGLTQRHVVGGGSIGYRLSSHTWIGAYEHSAVDASSSTVGAHTRVTGGWGWHEPGRSWALHASVGRSRLGDSGFVTISGWQASAGFTQRLMWDLLVMANYTHLNSRGAYLNTRHLIIMDGVRISVGWTPRLRSIPTIPEFGR